MVKFLVFSFILLVDLKAFAEEISYEGATLKYEVKKLNKKGKNVPIEGEVSNKSTKPVIFFFQSVECFKGDLKGTPKYTFGIGERAFNLFPKQSKNWKFKCKFDERVESNKFRIVINGLYENTGSDGKTAGAVIEEKVEMIFE